MTSELDTLNVASQFAGLHADTTANEQHVSPEDLSPPPTPISPATSPALVNKLDNTQALFEVRSSGKIYGKCRKVQSVMPNHSANCYLIQIIVNV